MPASRDYENWTLVQIREELRARKAKISGRKKELIDRLTWLDLNHEQAEVQNEYEMITPDPATYKDLHAGMQDDIPDVSLASIRVFLEQYDKVFDEKCKDFYKERFLRSLRCSLQGETLYVTSTMWAEMKKAVSYKVDIILDQNGVVQESQCECGAGQGPGAHCKHVATVLYGLSCFKSTGEISTELTCTQVLQTFHKCKPHKGTPMKAEDLQAMREKQQPVQYDPRPDIFQNRSGKQQEFRNQCINSQLGLPARPVMSLFYPANMRALCKDHDYMEHTPEDEFLRQNMIISVTREEADQIERDTRGQSRSKTWQEQRTLRLTSSNFGTICKATDRRDKAKLAKALLCTSDINVPAVHHGRIYEPVAISKYEQLTGTKTTECGMFVSQENPMLAASPDRVLNSVKLVEVKCPFSARKKPITSVTVPYLRMCQGTMKLHKEHDYYYQIQGQLYCANRQMCDLVVFTVTDMKIISIERDDTFIGTMVSKLKDFYHGTFREALLDEKLYMMG